ncbi:MAG: hypothetical protein JW839_13680 [Candidatus Lokiarchaeota archaeon]|nr:hypothetical protein [Candidatus Lokiarchaeota archaeon]
MAVAYVLYPLFICIQLAYGVYLLKRALVTRVHALIALFAISLLMVVDVIVTDLEIGPKILRDLVMMDYTIFYVLFTKYAFFRKQKAGYRPVLAIISALRLVHFIELQLFDQTMPPTNPVDTPAKLAQYAFHVALISCMHAIALGYLARASFMAHRAAEKQHLEPWIVKRNLLIGVASLLYATQPILWLFVPTDGNAYVGSWAGFATGVSIMILVLGHATISLFSWVMPARLKAWLNRGTPQGKEIVPEGLPEKVPELIQKALSSRETMLIVDFLGNILAHRIDKSPGAAKGLLLLAVQEWQDTSGKAAINFLDFREIVSTTLQRRLAGVNVPGPAQVVDELLADITRNQAMILMMII